MDDFWTMRLKDVINLMDATDKGDEKIPFDLVYSDCNRKKKTGGKIIERKGVIKCGLPWNLNDTFMIGIRTPGNTARPDAVHCRLIIEFNGQTVTY